MRVGEIWRVDFLDHFENTTDSAWSSTDKLKLALPLCRAVGFVAKVDSEAVALAVSYGSGESTSPLIIMRSAIVSSERMKVPPLRRKRAPG